MVKADDRDIPGADDLGTVITHDPYAGHVPAPRLVPHSAVCSRCGPAPHWGAPAARPAAGRRAPVPPRPAGHPARNRDQGCRSRRCRSAGSPARHADKLSDSGKTLLVSGCQRRLGSGAGRQFAHDGQLPGLPEELMNMGVMVRPSALMGAHSAMHRMIRPAPDGRRRAKDPGPATRHDEQRRWQGRRCVRHLAGQCPAARPAVLDHSTAKAALAAFCKALPRKPVRTASASTPSAPAPGPSCPPGCRTWWRSRARRGPDRRNPCSPPPWRT